MWCSQRSNGWVHWQCTPHDATLPISSHCITYHRMQHQFATQHLKTVIFYFFCKRSSDQTSWNSKRAKKAWFNKVVIRSIHNGHELGDRGSHQNTKKKGGDHNREKHARDSHKTYAFESTVAMKKENKMPITSSRSTKKKEKMHIHG